MLWKRAEWSYVISWQTSTTMGRRIGLGPELMVMLITVTFSFKKSESKTVHTHQIREKNVSF